MVDSAPLRAELRLRFERWLDGVLADEPPPAGVDAELLAELQDGAEQEKPPPGADLASLWQAMIAVRGEVGLQGRAFSRLEQALAPLGGRADALLQALDRPAGGGGALRRLRRELLGPLFDLRDRLDRGLSAVRGVRRPGRLARWFGARRLLDVVAALEQGYQLAADALDDDLAQLEVTPVARPGDPFDPHRMGAVEIVARSGAAEGTVLDVLQQGYEWQEELLRTAQVRLAGPAGTRRQE